MFCHVWFIWLWLHLINFSESSFDGDEPLLNTQDEAKKQ
jgi:hypothetical protein